jgi:uncharacterized protein YjdB
VICYTGLLSVTPLGNAKASKSDSSSNTSNSLNVAAGQMVEITTEVPPGGYQPQTTPSDVQRASMDSTDVPDLPPPAAIAATHPWHWALLFGGFMAVATGLVFAVDRGTTTAPQKTPTSGCPVGVPPQQCN